jgi:PAS domain S-box-containing protein
MVSASAALTGSYDYGEVARSVLIAIAASYAALDLAGRVNAARGRVRLAWLSGGAIAMGIGIWAMHLKAMLAFHLPVPTAYHWPTVLAALLVAIFASVVALHVTSRRKMDGVEALTGSIIMGAGIAGLHYILMAAMRLPAITQYSAFLVACSILFAILFSLAALFMAFGLREETRWSVPRRLGSAIVMGIAISAMHYTGMAAASFFPGSPPDLSHTVSESPIGGFEVVIATLIVLVAAATTSSVDRRQAREQLRLVVDTTPAMLYSAGPDGYLDFFNKRWLDYLGFSLDDSLGWGWTSAIHPKDLEDLVSKWRLALATGEPYETQARVRRADGEYRWMLLRKVPLHDQSGNIVKWYGSGVDIEERRQAEDVVRRSEEHLRLVIDTTPAMLLSARPDGYVDFFNKRWLEYVGISLEDMWGWRWINAFHPEDVEDVVGRWRSSVATGRPFEAEARLRRADGEFRLMLLRKVPLRDETGSVVKWYGSATDIEDRKRAEEELKSSEEQYRVIVEAASDAVISMDESGGILLANPATARIFGYDPAALIGKPLTVLMPEFMRKLHEAGFRRYLATGERHLNWQGAEVTALRKNGQEFSVEVSFGEMISNGHKVFTGFIRDISEKKRAEDELRKQKEVFQKIFEHIPVTISFVGQDGHIEMVNPEWERTLGWTVEEIRKQNLDLFAEFYPDPQYRQWVLDLVAASNGQWTDRKVRVRDGSVAIGRNITERKRAEAELRESEARFRLVADSAPVLIWMSGADKLCTYFNKPWLDFTGRSFEQELGNGWAEGVDPEDLQRCLDTYTQAFDRRESFRMEYRLRRHDGEFRWVSDTGVPRVNPNGSFAGYIGSCIDVTDERGAEEQLRHAQEDLARVTRLVGMGELAATIAHEVNQPLTAIVVNGQFCLRRLDDATSKPDELRVAIRGIVNDGTRASAVISRIRGLLKKGTPDWRELDINQIIQDVTFLLHNEFMRNRVFLRTELAADLPRVHGDPVLLQQVLINLIMNAIEATISSTGVRREIVLRSAKNRDGVLVQVQDSGPGIAPEVADRIFEPFFTTKAKGIGMGLSISHSIIESRGGRLGIAPSSHGALFEFTLPTDDSGVS